jgi:hypothetical protein
LRYEYVGDNNNLPGGKRIPKLSVLDQLLIPDEKKYINIETVEDAWSVIRSMKIRGRFKFCFVFLSFL